jgi:hypothetical protein
MLTPMATTNEDPEPWAKSEAKKMLELLILDGTVTEESDPNQVYNSQDEFQEYEIRNFKTNLRNLLATVRRNEERAQLDSTSVASFREINPRQEVTRQGYPYWDTSVARTMLSIDIDDGLNQTMTPSQLYNMREEYQAYPLDVFRKHIHQECNRRLKKSYGMFKQEKKEKKTRKNGAAQNRQDG